MDEEGEESSEAEEDRDQSSVEYKDRPGLRPRPRCTGRDDRMKEEIGRAHV